MRGDKEKEKRQEDEKERLRKLAILRSAMDETLRHPAGQKIIAYLFFLCGYDQKTLAREPATGKVDFQASLYNAARREVYIDLRKLASPKLLRAVEEPTKRSAPATKKQRG